MIQKIILVIIVLSLFFSSSQFIFSSAQSIPTVIHSIQDQYITTNSLFDFSLNINDIFSNPNNDFLNAFVTINSINPPWLNITKQISPVLLGSVGTTNAFNVEVINSIAYLADYNGGFRTINVTNSSNPILMGQYVICHPDCVKVVNQTAYVVCDDSTGLVIINATNLYSPILIGSLGSIGYSRGVVVNDQITYVSTGLIGSHGLQTINITNLNLPTLLTSYGTTNGYGITMDGYLIYMADLGGGLKIFNATNPINPTLVTTYGLSGAIDVKVKNQVAYVADFDHGLQIIDVSNPSNPILIGTYATSGFVHDVTICGQTAFLANIGQGLQIIDITFPQNSTFLGGSSITSNARGITKTGKIIYVANNSGIPGLYIFDAGNTTFTFSGITPSIAGNYPIQITVTDESNNNITANFNIIVLPNSISPPLPQNNWVIITIITALSLMSISSLVIYGYKNKNKIRSLYSKFQNIFNNRRQNMSGIPTRKKSNLNNFNNPLKDIEGTTVSLVRQVPLNVGSTITSHDLDLYNRKAIQELRASGDIEVASNSTNISNDSELNLNNPQVKPII